MKHTDEKERRIGLEECLCMEVVLFAGHTLCCESDSNNLAIVNVVGKPLHLSAPFQSSHLFRKTAEFIKCLVF